MAIRRYDLSDGEIISWESKYNFGDYVTFDDYETLASDYEALMDKYKVLVDKLGEMSREG